MFTISYKGHFIHGYCDKLIAHILVISETGQYTISNLKSCHAAKCYVTRNLILKTI